MNVNPVLRRELLERWRGRRAFWVLTVFVLLLGAAAQFLYWIGSSALSNQFGFGFESRVDAGPILGRFMFENMLAFVLLLVLFVAPGYAAAQISGERERKTLGLLQITALRPSSLVLGKLASSVAWVGLLVITSLPFAAALFFLGGVSPSDLARALVFILVIAVAIGAIALGVSSLVKRTTAAVVITYATVLFLTVGTLFTLILETIVVESWDRQDRRSAITMYANPYLGLTDAVRAQNGGSFGELPSILSPFAELLPRQNRANGNDFFDAPRPAVMFAEPAFPDQLGGVGFEQGFAQDIQIAQEQQFENDFGGGFGGGFGGFGEPARRQPVWLISLGLYSLAGLAAFGVATHRVSVPAGRSLKERDAKATVAPAATSDLMPAAHLMPAPTPSTTTNIGPTAPSSTDHDAAGTP